MVEIVTRATKGTPLTNTELDTNFTNLKTAVEAVEGSSGGLTAAQVKKIAKKTILIYGD